MNWKKMFHNNYFPTAILMLLLALPMFSCGQENRAEEQTLSQNQELSVNLIAHRGGIVDENRIENSEAAISEAIRRGYWMLEIDLRKTRDGRIILHHDSNFERYYEDPRSVEDLDWEEIQTFRSDIGNSRPLLLEEVAEMAAGKIRFMLDIKGGDFEEADYREIERILDNNELLSTAFVLSDAEAQQHFFGKASISRGLGDILQAAEAGENVSELYHLFELGGNLDREMIEQANGLGVKVVAAINVFRYSRSGDTEEERWEAAKQDIERLMDLGVTDYQVDSVYEPLFR